MVAEFTKASSNFPFPGGKDYMLYSHSIFMCDRARAGTVMKSKATGGVGTLLKGGMPAPGAAPGRPQQVVAL